MWYLTTESSPRTIYVELSKDITIGRSVDAQVCNFAIPDDPSISRRHATLSVSPDGHLFVQDLGSRYGTFVNDFDVKLDGVKRKLQPDDTVRFGKMTSVWKVHEARFVTCTSTLKGENMQNLKVCLEKLKGVLKNEWDDTCAYLTMPAITLTIKVVLALAQGSHIVTTEFWNQCVDAVSKQTRLPDPLHHSPQIIESTLNKDTVSFHPQEERKKLFAGKTFVFFSRRQLDMYKAVLIKCSSTPLLLSDTKMTKSSLCEPNVVVIQFNLSNCGAETQAQKNQITEIVNYMKSKGKRCIADAEIGLAILYCTTATYCNPEYNFASEIIKEAAPASGAAKILAQETQEATQKLQRDNVIINESLNTSSKRKLSEENGDNECNATKKQATESSTAAPIHDRSSDSIKRKRDSSEEVASANKKVAVETGENGLFDFLNNSTSEENHFQEKKLNLKKPVQKRSGANEEEELFNFVEDESKPRDDSHNIFDSNTAIKIEKPEHKEESVDINALRGANLKDLENANMDAPPMKKIKIEKEDPDDLDTKMNDLDLGTTILTIKKELIIKKEPIEVLQQDYSQMNFKKFKKVWPLHMHVTVIPRSTVTIEIPDDDETPAAACGTTPERSEASDITQSDSVQESTEVAKVSTDILKELTEQHGISDAVEMETDSIGVSHEPIEQFMSQAY